MIGFARAPEPRLRGRVALLWHQTNPLPTAGIWALPEGTVELVFDLGDEGPPFLVCGPHARPFFIGPSGPTTVVAAHIRPSGARGLFGVPMSDLRDVLAPLDAFWGREASQLRDRLLEMDDPHARLALLESALVARYANARDGHSAVSFSIDAARRPNVPTIATLAEESGLSARRLTSLFQEELGLSPKVYLRLRRFQRSLRAAQSRPDWGEIAALCGYCDQSHLIRDYQDFAHLSPTAYLARRAHHPNHYT